MSNNCQQRQEPKINLIGPKSFFSLNKHSQVYCSYCQKLLLVSTIGSHFSTACKKSHLAKGLSREDIPAKEDKRKRKRSASLCQKGKVLSTALMKQKKTSEKYAAAKSS